MSLDIQDLPPDLATAAALIQLRWPRVSTTAKRRRLASMRESVDQVRASMAELSGVLHSCALTQSILHDSGILVDGMLAIGDVEERLVAIIDDARLSVLAELGKLVRLLGPDRLPPADDESALAPLRDLQVVHDCAAAVTVIFDDYNARQEALYAAYDADPRTRLAIETDLARGIMRANDL